jgi:hypothetical protein
MINYNTKRKQSIRGCDVYCNLSSAGAYAGQRKIYDILKQNHENAPCLYNIRQWLQSKDASLF